MKKLIATLGIILLVLVMVDSENVFENGQIPDALKGWGYAQEAQAQQRPEGLKESQAPAPPAPGQAPGGPKKVEQAPIEVKPPTPKPDAGLQVVTVTREWTTIEIFLSVAILVFALAIFVLQSILVLRLKLEWTPQSILRFNGITLIVSGALLLVVAGYSNQQVAPVMGLLGTIAGYLLGARERTEK
jgi:hypothetical protein